MANLRDGIETVHWLNERLAGLKAVAETLEKLGGLDDAVAAHDKALASRSTELTALTAKVASAKSEAETLAKSQAESIKQYAARAKALMAEAEAKAEAIVAKAKAEAEVLAKKLRDDAEAEVKKVRAAWDADLAKLRSTAAEFESRSKVAQEIRDAVAKEHEALAKKLEALKEQAKKWLE